MKRKTYPAGDALVISEIAKTAKEYDIDYKIDGTMVVFAKPDSNHAERWKYIQTWIRQSTWGLCFVECAAGIGVPLHSGLIAKVRRVAKKLNDNRGLANAEKA